VLPGRWHRHASNCPLISSFSMVFWQCVAVFCIVLQRVAVRCRVLPCCVGTDGLPIAFKILFIVCCSMLQCVAVCCGVLKWVAVGCSGLDCDAGCCNVLQCVAV